MKSNSSLNSHYIVGIDGIRAIAVISVIIYNINASLLPGGFTGVDIFFVISGYVISLSLSKSTLHNFLPYIISFYRKRLLRILPALLTCIVITTIVSNLFIPSSWLSSENKRTALSAFLGLSNFALVLSSDGYFAPRSEFNPFLHTWSLAIEEQFYLFFPLIFFLVSKLKHNNSKSIKFLSFIIIPIFTILSLSWSYIETKNSPILAYLWLPSRFWELAIGSVLFTFHSRNFCVPRTQKGSSFVLVFGIILVCIGLFFSSRELFPFPWAIVPVMGSLFLVTGVSKKYKNLSYLQKIFESPGMIYIGKISYSLYLWHWPVITLFRWTVGIENQYYIIIALVLIFSLSSLSYHFVESPIRQNSYLRDQTSLKVILSGLIAIFLCLCISKVIFDQHNLITLSVTKNIDDWDSALISHANPEMNKIDEILNSSQRRLFVIGDSHAGTYGKLIRQVSIYLGIKTVLFSEVGCPIASLLEPTTQKCLDIHENNLQTIGKFGNPGDIVFLASLRLNRLDDQWKIFDEETIISRQKDYQNRALALEQASEIIQEFENQGMYVLIDAPKPIFRSPPFRCSDWFNEMNPICKHGFTISRDFLLEYRKPVMNSLEILKKWHTRLIVWDPFFILCPNVKCSAFQGNKPLFFDGDHLSGYGNKILFPSFVDQLSNIWDEHHKL